MTAQTDKPVRPPITLRVQLVVGGKYEVRNGDNVLGATQVEMLAVWNAVTAAEELSKGGSIVRVVAIRDGIEIVEFVAVPKT
jgi:transketolase C-terminal domain/subunit